MKFTEGAFRDWGYELTKREYQGRAVGWDDCNGKPPPGQILVRDNIADITLQQVLTRPEEFDVVATMNLNGDYLSDALAAQVGGIGIAPGANINYLTTLGHSVFLADLVHDAYAENWQTGADEDGNPVWNVEGYLNQTLNFSGRTFDVVLLWTALDYLPEHLVAPVVAHLFAAMNPGGQVLAFFHTRLQGEEAAYCRFHVTPGDDVEMQLTQQFPIQRASTNRSIERLFAGWSGHRQFLAKDSVSEVIITR